MIEKIKLSIQNEIFNRECFFHSGPLSGRRETGPGLNISSPRMKISNLRMKLFVRGGNSMVLSCVRARMNLFDPRPLWVGFGGSLKVGVRK